MFIKKFLSVLIIFSFLNGFFTPVLASETKCLYKIKKTTISNVKNIVEFYARQNNNPFVDGDDYYSFVRVSSDNDDIWAATYEQIDKDVYMYLYSPSDKNQVLKDLKIRFNKNKLSFSKENSKVLLAQKNELIKNVLNHENEKLSENNIIEYNTNSVYDFSDEAQQKYNEKLINSEYKIQNSKDKIEPPSLKGSVKQEIIQQNQIQIPNFNTDNQNQIPSNMTLNVLLQSSINTSSIDSSDKILAILQNDILLKNGVLIPKGSLIYGSAKNAQKAGGAYKNASVLLEFDTVMTEDGVQYSFSSAPIELTVNNTGMSRSAKVAGTVLLATAVGVAMSAIFGSISNTNNMGRTIAIGAAGGAITGGLSLINAKGEDIEVKEGTILTVVTK